MNNYIAIYKNYTYNLYIYKYKGNVIVVSFGKLYESFLKLIGY